ncbi:MAG: sodium:proton antiporter [Firmicutes bacterium]|nr:sodium:proton antiporter [Bacillota bacterium]
MYGSVFSLLPFAVVIPVAIWTRQVIPGLLCGLLVGAYMLTPQPIGGLQTVLNYLFKELQVAGNVRLIVFLYLFGSFVGLLRISGGVSGLARWLSPRIHSSRAAFAVTWASSALTFMAPDFRIITVAPVMRPLLRTFRIAPDDMSYAINVTSTPLISLIPLGTAFVGYMVGLLATALKHSGAKGDAYPLFLQSIPFNFFSLAILALGIYFSFFRGHQHEKMAALSVANTGAKPLTVEASSQPVGHRGLYDSAQGRAELADGQKDAHAAARGDSEEVVEPIDVYSAQVRPSALHLAIPIAVLVSLTLFFTWWSGYQAGGQGIAALVRADASVAMIQAIVVTLIVSSVLYAFRGVSLDRVMFGVLAGGNEMMGVIMLLVLVWAVSGVSTDLGFGTFVGGTIGHVVPKMLIAPALFVFGSLLSYFIGSSFGAWGILMPLGFTLAQSTHASLALIAGAVFASGTLGGFASPLSDNTVAMSTVMKFSVMRFTRKLLPSTLIAGGAATIGYTVAGLLM